MKLIYLLISLLFIIPIVSADLGTFTQNNCVALRTTSNYSQINISTVSVGGVITAINSPMQNLAGDTFNYTYCGTATLGEYIFDWYPCEISCENTFSITPNGDDFNISKAIFFVFILAVLLFFLFFSIYAINKAEKAEWQIFYICVTYLLLFSDFFLGWFVSKNYLYSLPLLESITWIAWIILGGLFFPFIIVVSGYLLKRQAELLLVDDFQKQGYTKEESLDMAKRQKRR